MCASDCLDIGVDVVEVPFEHTHKIFSYGSNENEINLFLFHFSILLLLARTRFRDVDECITVYCATNTTTVLKIPIHVYDISN